MKTAGVILAGGESLRMGQDKAMLTLAGQTMAARVAACVAPQLDALAINANGDPRRFDAMRLPVLPDDVPDTGPLAGVLAGMRWATSLAPAAERLVSVPVDTPFIPTDLVARLAAASLAEPNRVVIAASGERDHPVVALWPVALADELAEWRHTASSHGVRAFLASTGFTVVTFPLRAGAPDPFLNVNTPADLTRAEEWLASDRAR